MTNEMIIASLCNLGHVHSLFPIFGFDPDTDRFFLPDISKHIQPLNDSGVTGMAVVDQQLILAVQHPKQSRFLVFDSQFQLVRTIATPFLSDVHSIGWMDGRLVVASTGTNQIVALDLERTDEHEVLWPKHKVDYLHLNSACLHAGDLYVCGHHGPDGEHRNNIGFVFSVSENRKIVAGLSNPHTLFVHQDRIHLLNSAEGTIRRVDLATGQAPVVFNAFGYVRGACVHGGSLIFGISASRIVSRSVGMDKVYEDDIPLDPQYKFNSFIQKLDLRTFETRSFNTTLMGPEIYDLVRFSVDMRGANIVEEPSRILGQIKYVENARRTIWAARAHDSE